MTAAPGPAAPPRTVGSRALRSVVTLFAGASLAACSTTVEGTGRAAGPTGSVSTTGSPTGSSSNHPTGPFADYTDAHDLWTAVIEQSSSTGGTVTATGVVSGAGIGGAQITAVYSRGTDGEPVARVGIRTPEDNDLLLLVTGGKAYVKGRAAVYVEYGYPADVAEEADDKQVLLTDDDSGLDVYAALDSFLDLCGPSPDDPASLDEGVWDGKPAVIVEDEKYGTRSFVDPAEGLVLGSVYRDETVTFEYSDERTSVILPNPGAVVTVEGL
ncbi:hypothetical protein ACXR2U_23105 [Jatrophihabitans sp. YIM 134969]